MNFVNSPTWIRYCACDASRTAPWPPVYTWLTEQEQSALAEFHHPARQSQWLWGRWLSKQAISNVIDVEGFREIEIVTRSEQGLGIQPQVRLNGQAWAGSLSIAHQATGVLLSLSLDEQIALGVDLACDVPTDTQFRSLWFTASEQQWIASDPAYRTGLVWGLKEALFKACSVRADGSSFRWTPTRIEIHPTTEGLFAATFFGNRIKELDVHVQQVARGLAVIVRLPRQKFLSHDSSPTLNTALTSWPVACSFPTTLASANIKEFVAEELSAFDPS